MPKSSSLKKKRLRTRMTAHKSVDEYLASVPQAARPALQRLRKIIKAAAPEATEGISYGMPVFRHHGVLGYYAAFKNHCSFFPGAAVVGAYRTELKAFETSRGTIRFTTEKQLPAALVRKIVKDRLAANEQRRGARQR